MCEGQYATRNGKDQTKPLCSSIKACVVTDMLNLMFLEEIMTTQTLQVKPQTMENCNRNIALERSVGKLLRGLDQFYSRDTSPLILM